MFRQCRVINFSITLFFKFLKGLKYKIEKICFLKFRTTSAVSEVFTTERSKNLGGGFRKSRNQIQFVIGCN
ncbi:hypothetical protein COS18_04840 [Candidatus Falkowbacteria bacterium CG02_land_8_20_14_3_00_36_14]|uniref:Uncharacterized protein n=1 Tax=Candidatus Falkowbacteria bacterium CG02_land_8_20_14_3_00_36_14 TaxID=1974560 RepID=A0A2M7DL55_9BACT|nr:MAG: hypothetical protein COS18_04840 [Candidatus Falkowbacteria bacterium CG02_land_8_20_14_3_00_36_14]